MKMVIARSQTASGGTHSNDAISIDTRGAGMRYWPRASECTRSRSDFLILAASSLSNCAWGGAACAVLAARRRRSMIAASIGPGASLIAALPMGLLRSHATTVAGGTTAHKCGCSECPSSRAATMTANGYAA